jgi:type VI protein secretion system component VasK
MAPTFAKYPFNPASQVQATLQDVNAIFHPKEGALWQFWQTGLSKFVTRDGNPIPEAPITVTPAFRGFLGRANAFTTAAYPGDAADPRLTYSVRAVIGADVERIRTALHGQTADFAGANASAKNFVWPGTWQEVQLTMRAQGGTEYDYPTYRGLWAVFRFVDDADRRTGSLMEMTLRAGRSGEVVRNRATGQPVTIRLDIVANPDVFAKGYFATLKCVAEVARQ